MPPPRPRREGHPHPPRHQVAVYYANRDLRLESHEVPEPGPGELLIQVAASGICGSDVMEWYRRPRAPVVLGHEVCGVVVETGSPDVPFPPGTRVVATHHVPCMTCRYCLAGAHTACELLHRTRFDPGGFAQYLRVPALNVKRGVLAVPDHVSDDAASMVEPLGCVLRAQEKIGLKPGQSVLILGSGVSGLLHLLAAKAAGAGPIAMTDLHPSRLERARESGADMVFDAREDLPARLRDGLGHGADIVLVCTGAPAALRQALEAVDREGTVLFFAPAPPGEDFPIPFNQVFWQGGVTLTSSYGAALKDLRRALDLIAWKRIDPLPLVTHRLPLARIQEGFNRMIAGGDSLKIIIDPRLG